MQLHQVSSNKEYVSSFGLDPSLISLKVYETGYYSFSRLANGMRNPLKYNEPEMLWQAWPPGFDVSRLRARAEQ